MANLATLKAALNAAIFQNNQNAITGEALNTILNSIIDTLGAGYRYAGVATPSANPGTIDNRVFYLATAAGTYTNFGAVQLDGKKLHIFIYDTTWHDVALDVPTNAALAVVVGSGTNSVQGKDTGCDANAAGAVALGNASAGDGSIAAEGAGAVAVGSSAPDGWIDAEGEGSVAAGYSGSNSELHAIGQGAHAEGCANSDMGGIIAAGDGSHAEGVIRLSAENIEASGDGSHAEGCAEDGGGILASGKGAHAEGFSDDSNFTHTASGDGSHVEGNNCTAQNNAEHAEGKYNLSNKRTTGTANEQAAGTTLSSVGCGTGSNDRKNAVEVMQNGDVYVKGVGGYDGTNPAQGGVLNIESFLGYLVLLAPQNRNRVDWSAESIIIDTNFGYCLTPFFDRVGGAELFRTYLSSMIDDSLHITSDFDSVDYLGLSGDARIENGSLDSGAVCCIYNNNGDQYYFIYEA